MESPERTAANLVRILTKKKQESIQVGCVPTAEVASTPPPPQISYSLEGTWNQKYPIPGSDLVPGIPSPLLRVDRTTHAYENIPATSLAIGKMLTNVVPIFGTSSS